MPVLRPTDEVNAEALGTLKNAVAAVAAGGSAVAAGGSAVAPGWTGGGVWGSWDGYLDWPVAVPLYEVHQGGKGKVVALRSRTASLESIPFFKFEIKKIEK